MHDNSVNIFHKHNCCVTTSLSMCCKRAAFATSKRSYHFLRELSLQKQSSFFGKPLYVYCEYADVLLGRDLSRSSYPRCSFSMLGT